MAKPPVKLYTVEEARAAMAAPKPSRGGKRGGGLPKEKKPRPGAAEKRAQLASMVGGVVLLDCRIPGRPKAWERTDGFGADGQRLNAEGHRQWMSYAADTFRLERKVRERWLGPVLFSGLAVFERPQHLSDVWPGERLPFWQVPDVDNIGKLTFDSIKAAELIRDDCLIQGIDELQKVYAAVGEPPSVYVKLVSLDPHAPVKTRFPSYVP